MLTASAVLLAIIGFGFSLTMAGKDDDLEPDSAVDSEDEVSDATTDELNMGNLNDLVFDDVLETETSITEPLLTSLPTGTSVAAIDDHDSKPEQSQYQGNIDIGSDLLEWHNAKEVGNSIVGGPGDTLVGGVGLGNFEIIVGSEGDPETQLYNLFEEDTFTGGSETIWLKNPDGETISRDALLSSDFTIQDDVSRNGVTLSLNGHKTLFIDDVSVDDFTENSFVLGNFRSN